jgi:hypothetical protein
MSTLAIHLDWASLFNFSQLGHKYKQIVKHEIRIRIDIILSRFIVTEQQTAFWRLIEQTNTCIFGGIVRTIMMSGNHAHFESYPPQMDMVVPCGTSHARSVSLWSAFWRTMGYTDISVPTESEPFESCTDSIVYYKHPVL